MTSENYNDIARFNARLLAIAGMFAGMNHSATFSMAAIIGAKISPLGWLTTLPVTCFVIGMAITSFPASQLMGRIGRRNGFMVGTIIAVLGNILAAFAVYLGAFWVFCLAILMVGISGGFAQLYRFAATDLATADLKPKVMSWVLLGGVAGALGPTIVSTTNDIIIGSAYVVTYLSIALSALMSTFVLSFLRSRPNAVKKIDKTSQDVKNQSYKRNVRDFLKEPRFIMTAFAGAFGYALMTLVMTAAPLAMIACAHPEDSAFFGITLHVVAMFAPSFFTGSLIARYGAVKISALGFLILIICAGVGMMGIEISHFWGALILLGIGWNFSFLGASSLITQLHTDEERATAQGLNDAIVMGTVAISSVLSGALMNLFGWNTILGSMLPFILLSLLLLRGVYLRASAPAKA